MCTYIVYIEGEQPDWAGWLLADIECASFVNMYIQAKSEMGCCGRCELPRAQLDSNNDYHATGIITDFPIVT